MGSCNYRISRNTTSRDVDNLLHFGQLLYQHRVSGESICNFLYQHFLIGIWRDVSVQNQQIDEQSSKFDQKEKWILESVSVDWHLCNTVHSSVTLDNSISNLMEHSRKPSQ